MSTEHTTVVEDDNVIIPYEIVVEPPDTEGNFTLFNIPCDDLNSDFLMQPVNEADYDSETQACVDTRTGAHRSFYDHYVTKRRKKKFVKGCGIESPAPSGSAQQSRVTTTVSLGRAAEDSVEAPTGPTSSSQMQVTSSSSPQPPVKTVDPGHLMAVSLLGATYGVQRGALSNAATRRIACGRMPPPLRPAVADTTTVHTTTAENVEASLHEPQDSVRTCPSSE